MWVRCGTSQVASAYIWYNDYGAALNNLTWSGSNWLLSQRVFWNGGGSAGVRPDRMNLATNEWIHIALTWKGNYAGSRGYMALYTNGNLLVSNAFSQVGSVTGFYGRLYSQIQFGRKTVGIAWWRGDMDDVAGFTNSLSSNNCFLLYNYGRTTNEYTP
jgi:hypothetical protein